MNSIFLKIPLSLAFVLLLQGAFSQGRAVNFSRVDWAAQTTDAATPEVLSQRLTAPYHTDVEKVRAIFRWITEHIDYATQPRISNARNTARSKPMPMDTLLSMKTVDEIVAYTVMQRRTAVCNGYARLFKTLCNYAGIRAEVVSGYARGGFGNVKFRSNHSWNAVYVDSAWHLVDATWASGYISYTNEFVRQYDDSYFFPDPQQFIRSHYPEDLKWSLLQNPPALQEFNQAPFRLTAFSKYGISGYAPASGVVVAAVGDTLQFHFALPDKLKGTVAPELTSDSMMSGGLASWEFIKPEVTGSVVRYTYAVESEQVEWIHLVYNNDVVLRYKLNIRKPKS